MSAAIALMLAPVFLCFKMAFLTSSVTNAGRPPVRPSALALAIPSIWRSRLISVSNSAINASGIAIARRSDTRWPWPCCPLSLFAVTGTKFSRANSNSTQLRVKENPS